MDSTRSAARACSANADAEGANADAKTCILYVVVRGVQKHKFRARDLRIIKMSWVHCLPRKVLSVKKHGEKQKKRETEHKEA